jgi:hypothetical protein
MPNAPIHELPDVSGPAIDLGPIVDVRAWVDVESTPDSSNPDILHHKPKGEPNYQIITVNSEGEHVAINVERGLFLSAVEALRKWSKGR